VFFDEKGITSLILVGKQINHT